MPEPIQIKRYPNRRFYARQAKAYVSLQDIERMVREGHTVEITDSQSGEDITRTVLAQIIMDQYPDKFSLFPTAMLHSILQANEAVSDFLRDYFQGCLTYLDILRNQSVPPPVQQPMEWMKAWFGGVYPGMPIPGWSARKPANPSPDETANDLRKRMEDLENRLRQMEAEAGKRGETKPP
jgi:polyhydroxyalkanoate synthesis repressor PhaR